MFFALAATLTTAANAEMIAGWDFSQYMGPGFNSTDNASLNADTLISNYSDLDANGVGTDSGYGTMYVDGSYGSTDIVLDGTNDEIMPSTGSLLSNSDAGIALFDVSNALISKNEGAQINDNDLAYTSQSDSAFNVVFGVDTSSVSDYTDFSLSFAALDTDSATLSISYSTDGATWSIAEDFAVTTADTAYTTSVFSDVSDTAYFMFTFNEIGTVIDNVSISGNAVPEPSAFAAIAGVFALAFVVNRRRKN